jgi:hypothetical protein
MLKQPDEIGVEHESAFEHTYNNEFNLSLLLFDLEVVLVDLFCESRNSLPDGLLIIQQSKLQSFVMFDRHKN